MNIDTIRQAVSPLLEWFSRHRRPMPWRVEPPDAYLTWISEIMLQQTRIEAAIPYFTRFIKRAPNVQTLAKISDEELFKLWEGLGYYSRAKNLKKAACIVCEQYQGKLPVTAKELVKLPGIGPYTAGAISSIAYGQPEPAVDGNVIRVLARLTDDPMDVDLGKNRTSAQELLRQCYPTGEAAGRLTEALMELGEVVCIPNGTPLCHNCPLNAICLGYKNGSAPGLPVKSPKKQRKIVRRTILILRCGDLVALRKRPETGLLSSLLEFPGLEEGEELTVFLHTYGLEPLSQRELGSCVHVFSHVEWHMTGLEIQCRRPCSSLIWHTPEEIQTQLALPTAFSYFRKKLLFIKQGENA